MVNIEIGYGLDGPGLECRWMQEISLPHNVQTGSVAHTVSLSTGTGVLSRG